MLSDMETSTIEKSHWDSLPSEMKDNIKDIAAPQVHRERLKQVRHIPFDSNPFGSCSHVFMFPRGHLNYFFYT